MCTLFCVRAGEAEEMATLRKDHEKLVSKHSKMVLFYICLCKEEEEKESLCIFLPLFSACFASDGRAARCRVLSVGVQESTRQTRRCLQRAALDDWRRCESKYSNPTVSKTMPGNDSRLTHTTN